MRHPLIITSSGKVVKKSQSVMRRAIDKARQEIMAQEDAEIFKILDMLSIEYSSNIKE
jgi:dsDNA-specific endonuclease/ATPase MutS2